jgi:hypothetical protein
VGIGLRRSRARQAVSLTLLRIATPIATRTVAAITRSAGNGIGEHLEPCAGCRAVSAFERHFSRPFTSFSRTLRGDNELRSRAIARFPKKDIEASKPLGGHLVTKERSFARTADRRTSERDCRPFIPVHSRYGASERGARGSCSSSDSRYRTQPRRNAGHVGTVGIGSVRCGSSPHSAG